MAAMAMQGILASDTGNNYPEAHIVDWSVSIADALIEKLRVCEPGKAGEKFPMDGTQ